MKSQKEELSRKSSSMMDSSSMDSDSVMGDLPARIADMEAEIRVLRDQNKRMYLTLSLPVHPKIHNVGLGNIVHGCWG